MSSADRGFTRGERAVAMLLAVASLVLRAVAYFHYRFDSDEPQHLHVAWGWTAGLVQYRDLFDNHAPLFHMATAPLLRLVGERPDVLLYMRAPMLPLFALVIWMTYLAGRELYSRAAGIWAAILLSLFPPFFLKSLEYRTDNAWTAVFSLIVLALLSGPLTAPRAFVIGLLLGIALCVSMKTLLLVGSFAVAAIATYVMCTPRDESRRFATLAAASAIGLPIAPAILTLFFKLCGALPHMLYCVVTFNELLTRTHHQPWAKRALYPLLLAAIFAIAWRLRGGRTHDRAAQLRFFFAVFTAFFAATLGCFWILISPRDYLPLMPLAAIFASAFILRSRRHAVWFALASALFIGFILYYSDGLRNATREHITMMDQVLGLTRKGEPLMDLKGETVYRRRPFYYIFEYITRGQMRSGLIADTIPEDLIAAKCYVAQADGSFFPPRGRRFMSENYLDLGRLRAAGQWLHHEGLFTIAISGRYVILNENGQAAGLLDNKPYTGARQLDAGVHRFIAPQHERLAVLWAPAFERGYSPFHLRDREF